MNFLTWDVSRVVDLYQIRTFMIADDSNQLSHFQDKEEKHKFISDTSTSQIQTELSS